MPINFKQGVTALLLNEGMRDDLWDKHIPALKDMDLGYRYIVASCHFAAATNTHYWKDKLIKQMCNYLGCVKNTATQKIDYLVAGKVLVYKNIPTKDGPERKILPSSEVKSALIDVGRVYAKAVAMIIERVEKFGPIHEEGDNSFLLETLAKLQPEIEPCDYATDGPDPDAVKEAESRIEKGKNRIKKVKVRS